MKSAPSFGTGDGLSQVKDLQPPAYRDNWQNDAYSYTEAIGELGYAVNLKANTLAECRLFVEKRKPGTDEWEYTDDPRALRVLRAFQPPQGEQPELLRQAAIHHEIAGES